MNGQTAAAALEFQTPVLRWMTLTPNRLNRVYPHHVVLGAGKIPRCWMLLDCLKNQRPKTSLGISGESKMHCLFSLGNTLYMCSRRESLRNVTALKNQLLGSHSGWTWFLEMISCQEWVKFRKVPPETTCCGTRWKVLALKEGSWTRYNKHHKKNSLLPCFRTRAVEGI